jgi:hypothetical protein
MITDYHYSTVVEFDKARWGSVVVLHPRPTNISSRTTHPSAIDAAMYVQLKGERCGCWVEWFNPNQLHPLLYRFSDGLLH